MLRELEDRFVNHRLNAFRLQALIPKYWMNCEPQYLTPMIDFYAASLPGGESQIKGEYTVWRAKWSAEVERPDNALDALASCPEHYPKIKFLLKILCTLPVTTASAERSFSMLRRLKTWLRSTMGNQRLTGLALLAASKDIQPSPEEVIDSFFLTKRRFLE